MRFGQRRARPRRSLRTFGVGAIAAALLVALIPSGDPASADVGGGFVQAGTAFDSHNRNSPVATGDMNRDGTSDIVFDGPSNTLMVGLVQPNGDLVKASGNEPQVPYSPVFDMAVGQLTADSNPDVVTVAADPSTGYTTAVNVYPGDGSGGLAAAITTDIDPGNVANGWLRVAVADVNDDGIDDLAVLNPSGNDINVLLSDGSGGLSPAPGSPYAVPSEMQGSDISLADLNHDGQPDIAVSAGCYNTTQPYCADGTAKVLVWDGNAADGFAPAAGSPFSVGTFGDIAIVDVNGDGRPDMAVGGQENGEVAVLLQDAAGRFAAGPDPPASLGGFGHLVAGFDPHLNQAYVAVATNDQLYVLLGSRSGALRQAPGSPYQLTPHPRTYVLSAAAGTIDGVPEVVVQSYGAGTDSLISLWADHLTTSASALQPRTTALFNDPGTQPNDITRYERSLVVDAGHIQQLQGWRPQIRASLYRLSDVTLAKDFVTAAVNGASVQVLLDGSDRRFGCHGEPNCVNPAYKWLRALNELNTPRTWMKTCDGVGPQHPNVPAGRGDGCIGQARDHNKFLLVSQAHFVSPDVRSAKSPLAQHMVLQTSSNNTPASYRNALNNALLTVNQPAVYRDYVQYFHRLAASYASRKQPSIRRFAAKFGHRTDTKTLASHDVSTWSFPQRRRHDPVLGALDGVRTTGGCANPGAGTADPVHNGVALAMSHIGGRTAVMRRLAALRHSGCNVDVAYADIGTRDRRILAHAGVGLHRVCLAAVGAPRTVTEYLHSKYMLVAGTQGGVGPNRRVVYTGSANLDDQGLTRTDDRLERYVEASGNAPVFDAYYSNFVHLVHLSQGHHATRRCISDN